MGKSESGNGERTEFFGGESGNVLGGTICVQISEGGIYGYKIGVPMDDRKLLFKFLGKHQVIVVEEGYPIACGLANSCVSGTGYTLIFLLDVSDTVSEGTGNLFSAVFRSVVYYNDFVRLTGLCQSAFQRLTEAELGVISWDGNTYLCHREKS